MVSIVRILNRWESYLVCSVDGQVPKNVKNKNRGQALGWNPNITAGGALKEVVDYWLSVISMLLLISAAKL
jgi:hypothetical protein